MSLEAYVEAKIAALRVIDAKMRADAENINPMKDEPVEVDEDQDPFDNEMDYS